MQLFILSVRQRTFKYFIWFSNYNSSYSYHVNQESLSCKCKICKHVLSMYKPKKECVGLYNRCYIQAWLDSEATSLPLSPSLLFCLSPTFPVSWLHFLWHVSVIFSDCRWLVDFRSRWSGNQVVWRDSNGPAGWAPIPWATLCEQWNSLTSLARLKSVARQWPGRRRDWQPKPSHVEFVRGVLFQQWKERCWLTKAERGSANIASPIFQVKNF